MNESASIPTVFVRVGCPFSFKVRLFLLEAGLLDRVRVQEISKGTREEEEALAILKPSLDKVSFPAAVFGPGDVIADSDAITHRLSGLTAQPLETLTEYSEYVSGPLGSLLQLHRELGELKKRSAQA